MVESKEKVAPKKAAPKKSSVPQGKRQHIHHVIRVISKDGSGSADAWTIQHIEEYLQNYMNNGWYLSATHFMGELPEGYATLWVLLKDS